MRLLSAIAARTAVLFGVLAAIAFLPWIADRDPAVTVLRALVPGREATPDAVAAMRAELGLDAGPWKLLRDWLGGLPRGDLGTSWITGRPVADTIVPALGVSLTLMAGALGVVAVITAAVCGPTLARTTSGRPARPAGTLTAALVAVPDFLVATLGIAVFGVWTGLLPVYGFSTPAHMVLPVVAMGLPGGLLLSRLVRESIADTADEDWVRLWRAAGLHRGRIARALLRRALPPLLPQIAVIGVGITGSAVAVETIFAIPGLGRAAFESANAQDLPVLQAAMAILIGLGFTGGVLARVAADRLTGTAGPDAAAAIAPPPKTHRRRSLGWLLATAGPLVALTAVGLFRDADAVDTAIRLTGPSLAHPLGTDALGRDVLARLAHGALWTVGAAALACLAAFLIGLALGFAPRLAHPLAEACNSLPIAIAGILVVVVFGRSQIGAVIAVTAVAWPPLAAHAASLVTRARAAGHIESRRALGTGPLWMMRRHYLPLVAGPLAGHAALRLPGRALEIATLGFLGLGADPDDPEWGADLAQSMPYLERAPLAVLVPAAAMIALAVAVISAVALVRDRRPRSGRPEPESSAPDHRSRMDRSGQVRSSMIPKTAPEGAAIAAMRVPGTSSGGATTVPPSSAA